MNQLQSTESYEEVEEPGFGSSREYVHEALITKKTIGKTLEGSPVLVLNADYTPLSHTPLSLWSWQVYFNI